MQFFKIYVQMSVQSINSKTTSLGFDCYFAFVAAVLCYRMSSIYFMASLVIEIGSADWGFQGCMVHECYFVFCDIVTVY